MEAYGLKLAIARLRECRQIVGYVHDNDGKARNITPETWRAQADHAKTLRTQRGVSPAPASAEENASPRRKTTSPRATTFSLRDMTETFLRHLVTISTRYSQNLAESYLIS